MPDQSNENENLTLYDWINNDIPEPIRKRIPGLHTLLRASVSAIPVVGGALDHLLFDRADSVRLENVEKVLKEMGRTVEILEERSLDLQWFESSEALAVFRTTVDHAQFEPDDSKIKVLARIAVVSGTKDLSGDKHKLSVLNVLSSLTYVQMRLLKLVAQVPGTTRTAGEGVSLTVEARFSDDIMKFLDQRVSEPFWKGELDVPLELNFLESVHLLRRQIWIGEGTPYVVTRLGKKVLEYLEKTDI